ncbi:hypothetical protein KM043_006597 [Ampulex compressa]|nr:hypothetical protein KM043_006597 [Ampulex compressa]
MCVPWSLDGQSLGLTQDGSQNSDEDVSSRYPRTHAPYPNLDAATSRAIGVQATRMHARRLLGILVAADLSTGSSTIKLNRPARRRADLPTDDFPLWLPTEVLAAGLRRRGEQKGRGGRLGGKTTRRTAARNRTTAVLPWRWSIARRSTDVATPRRVSWPAAPARPPSAPTPNHDALNSLRNNPETDEPPPPPPQTTLISCPHQSPPPPPPPTTTTRRRRRRRTTTTTTKDDAI